MIVTINPSEALHLLEVVLKNPMPDPRDQEVLLAKIKSEILDDLEDLEGQKSLEDYRSWSQREQEKIDLLSQKNLSIQPPLRRNTKKK